MQITTPQYFSVSDACRFCSLSRRTLDYAKERGELPFVRKGRKILFRAADLTQWMDRDLIDVTADVARLKAEGRP